MMRVLAFIADWWFAPAPARRLAAVRIWVGLFTLLYLWTRLPALIGVAHYTPDHFRPIGVVRLLIDRPLAPGLVLALTWATFALSFAFLLGVLHRWIAPAFALLLLWTITYRNCWGMVFHTENLMVLHVLVLAAVAASDAWSIDAWWRRRRGGPELEAVADDERHGWPLKLLGAITCAAYVLAGVAKLRIAGTAWITSAELRNQIAFDNLRKAVLGSDIAPLAVPLLGQAKLFVALAAMSIVMELGAPLALLHRRVALIWSLGAWSFHVGVVLLMNIWFPYPLAFIAYVPLLRCERPLAWLFGKLVALKNFRARRRQAGSAAT